MKLKLLFTTVVLLASSNIFSQILAQKLIGKRFILTETYSPEITGFGLPSVTKTDVDFKFNKTENGHALGKYSYSSITESTTKTAGDIFLKKIPKSKSTELEGFLDLDLSNPRQFILTFYHPKINYGSALTLIRLVPTNMEELKRGIIFINPQQSSIKSKESQSHFNISKDSELKFNNQILLKLNPLDY